jgi:hypothetical protein
LDAVAVDTTTLKGLVDDKLDINPSASQTVAYGAAGVQTILKMADTPTGAPLEIQDNSGAPVFAVSAAGGVTVSSATFTGDAEIRGVIKAGSTPAAITDGSGNVLASKLAGTIPQTVTVFSSPDCDAQTPDAVGQFCYDTTDNLLSISTIAAEGGYASFTQGAW